MGYLDYYKQICREGVAKTPPQSLIAFLNKNPQYFNHNICEFGCGHNPLNQYIEFPHFKGIDISMNSIMELNQMNGGEFLSMNLCEANIDIPHCDVYIDSHLLHCLINPIDRNTFFNNLKKAMGPYSLYMGECLVRHKQFLIPRGDYYDHQFQILKSSDQMDEKYLEDGLFPYRYVPDVMSLEEEFLKNGFEIDTFIYRSDLCIDIFEDPSISGQHWPHLVQFILSA